MFGDNARSYGSADVVCFAQLIFHICSYLAKMVWWYVLRLRTIQKVFLPSIAKDQQMIQSPQQKIFADSQVSRVGTSFQPPMYVFIDAYPVERQGCKAKTIMR